jgi:hypothetical protein
MAVFDETTPISDVTVDNLVGEGKKFKTVDDLARSKFESDRVIQAREQELASLREELSKRETAEEMIRKLQERQNTPPQTPGQPEQEQPPAKASSFTDEDLEKRIKEIQSKTTLEERVAANVEEVTKRLIAEFGSEDKANEVVNRKAAELGVSPKFLQETAAHSPKAFYVQLGLTEAPKGTVGVPRSDVKTDMFQHSASAKPGTYAYYQDLKSKMKDTEYFSPKIQNQLMKDAFAAAERGEDFFKT